MRPVASIGHLEPLLAATGPNPARDIGLYLGLIGIGAIAGSLVAARRTRPTHTAAAAAASALALAVGTSAAAPASPLAQALPLLAVGGAAVIFNATIHSALQTRAPNHHRGKASALYTLAKDGSTVIGAPTVGALAAVTHPRISIGLGALAAAAAALYLRKPSPSPPRAQEAERGTNYLAPQSDREPRVGTINAMVHESAASGYRQRAETYQEARPTYHRDLVERFVGRYALGPIADVGAGTGIFTSQLVSAGLEVVAVEPVAEMRALLTSRLPDVRVLDGTAESIPVEAGTMGTAVAAQAFHWFDHCQALDEIHRVLRTGGFLVTVWNVRDESIGWVDDYNKVQARFEGDTPRHRSMVWRAAIEDDTRFELVDDWTIKNPQSTTVEGVVNRFLSTSFIAALPIAEQELAAQEIREIVGPFGPAVDFPYRSELQAWRKTA